MGLGPLWSTNRGDHISTLYHFTRYHFTCIFAWHSDIPDLLPTLQVHNLLPDEAQTLNSLDMSQRFGLTVPYITVSQTKGRI